MWRMDNLISWLMFAFIGAGAIVLSVYVFAFLLPFVLLVLAATILINLGRYWYMRYKLKGYLENFMAKSTKQNRRSAKHDDVIDVEYEVVDDGKSKK